MGPYVPDLKDLVAAELALQSQRSLLRHWIIEARGDGILIEVGRVEGIGLSQAGGPGERLDRIARRIRNQPERSIAGKHGWSVGRNIDQNVVERRIVSYRVSAGDHCLILV